MLADAASTAQPGVRQLVDHVKPYSPEWASAICDVPAATIRRDRKRVPRPRACRRDDRDRGHDAAVPAGRRSRSARPSTTAGAATNAAGRARCSRCLVGALEVPGGTLGTTVRLNRPADNRWSSVKPGPDGFMDYPMNPTDKDDWISRPTARSAHRTLVPLAADSAWSQALGPTHLAWMMLSEDFEQLPRDAARRLVRLPHQSGHLVLGHEAVGETMAKFPFIVCFAYTRDETNHIADVLLPDCTDLEGLQLLRIGGTKYVEQFWDHQGFALREPRCTPQGEARDFTWIATELARRTGLLKEYNAAINRGAAGVKLSGQNYDFSLDAGHSARCRSDLGRESAVPPAPKSPTVSSPGARVVPRARIPRQAVSALAVVPVSEARRGRACASSSPTRSSLFRIGKELGRRLHEQGINWWDRQLEEYEPLPKWHDLGALWEDALAKHYRFVSPTTRSG